MGRKRSITARIIKADGTVKKSAAPEQIQNSTIYNDLEPWITPAVELKGLKTLVTHSSILPQCIRAYKNNIAGFGIGVKYKEDYHNETDEMKAEFTKLTEIIELLNMDMDTKEVFEDIIEAREIYGVAYLEVIRNLADEVIGVEFINDIVAVQKTKPLDPYIEIEYPFKDRTEKRIKRFCKYRQTVSTKTVYFKELGDPRHMDKHTGNYAENVPYKNQANEILEFTIGAAPYGEVRWLGQILSVDGSREAEELNNNYFKNGRHVPVAIVVSGDGGISDKTYEELTDYMNDVKGKKGQHGFLLIECAPAEGKADFENTAPPSVEIKDLAPMLQKDELFQEYLNNSRRKIQSSFQLPDLYVGYTSDYNRATSQTVQEVTEKQVFQPERESLAWAINNKLLAGYNFKYVKAFFKSPEISNPDDIMKILSITERAGGLTPNKAKEITYRMYGEESENYEGDWGDTPLVYTNSAAARGAGTEQSIMKSADNNEIVAIMKEVRAVLQNRENDV